MKNFDPSKISYSNIQEMIKAGLAEETASGDAVIIRIGDRVLVLKRIGIVYYGKRLTTPYGGVPTVDHIERFYVLVDVLPRWLTSDKSVEISTEVAGQGLDLERQIANWELLIDLISLVPTGAASKEFLENGFTREFVINITADFFLVFAAYFRFAGATTRAALWLHGTNIAFEGSVGILRAYEYFTQENNDAAGFEALLRLIGVSLSATEKNLLEKLNIFGKGKSFPGELLYGKNAKGHLIKHADALGFGKYTPQQLQKMVPQLKTALKQLLQNADPALTRVGDYYGHVDAFFYISGGKMIITEADGTFITVIGKTSNAWYQKAVKP